MITIDLLIFMIGRLDSSKNFIHNPAGTCALLWAARAFPDTLKLLNNGLYKRLLNMLRILECESLLPSFRPKNYRRKFECREGEASLCSNNFDSIGSDVVGCYKAPESRANSPIFEAKRCSNGIFCSI